MPMKWRTLTGKAMPGLAWIIALAPLVAAQTPQEFTPYQKNPFFFADKEAAIQALSSPDGMLQRSAVQWLGDWTATSGSSGSEAHIANRSRMKQETQQIPALIRAVREMPTRDSQQAARLLALIGAPAKSAIPVICAAMAQPAYNQDFVGRADLLNSLVHLCGGPDKIAPALTGFLNDRNPETRRAVATALSLATDPTFVHISPSPQDAYPTMTVTMQRQWRRQFLGQTVPALAKALEDRDKGTRLAAAQSLERLTYFDDAPWQTALAPLNRAALSVDSNLRLAALRVLAFIPDDISPSVGVLRQTLRRGEPERSYALAALAHVAQTDRQKLGQSLLQDIRASDPARRRVGMSDLREMVLPVWSGRFAPDSGPLPAWWNDQRLERPDPILTKKAAACKATEDSALREEVLRALVAAASDSDIAIRRDAGAALEKIGRWQLMMRGGISPASQRPTLAQVQEALSKSSDALRKTDPAQAERLTRLLHPTEVF